MDRNELLSQMHAGRHALEATLARVDAGQMDAPVLHDGWSVKDLLAHLAFWERRAVRLYETLARGEKPTGEVGSDAELDALNARVYSTGHERPADEVRTDEAAAYLALLQVAETAPEADLFDPQRFPWTEGRPLAAWIEGNAHGHYEEHLPELVAWLDQAGE